MTSETSEEIERLIRTGRRTEALKHLRDNFQLTDEEAELLVSTKEREIGISSDQSGLEKQGSSIDANLRASITDLVNSGKKTEAVQMLISSGYDPLTARVTVEEVAKGLSPGTISTGLRGCLRAVAKAFGIFLMIVAVILLDSAAVIFFLQNEAIKNSDRVQANVVELQTIDNGASAPVLEYEWKGVVRRYESNYFTSPAEYHVGQELWIFVERDDHESIVIDTFSERWALIIGLSVPGLVLMGISIPLLYFARRRF